MCPVVISENFIVDSDIVEFNRYDRPLYHQCQHVDFVKPLYGSYWNSETVRCGGDSMYLITYTGGTTGNVYTKHLCTRHAIEFLENSKKYFSEKGDTIALDKIENLIEEMKNVL